MQVARIASRFFLALTLPLAASGCSSQVEYNTGADAAKEEAEVATGKSDYKGRIKVTKPPGPNLTTERAVKPAN